MVVRIALCPCAALRPGRGSGTREAAQGFMAQSGGGTREAAQDTRVIQLALHIEAAAMS